MIVTTSSSAWCGSLALVASSQLTSICLLQSQALGDTLRRIGIVTLVSQLATFSTFTYFPPFSLFEDLRNGMRGIPAEAEARPMNHAGPRATLGAIISASLRLVGPRRRPGKFKINAIGELEAAVRLGSPSSPRQEQSRGCGNDQIPPLPEAARRSTGQFPATPRR